MTDSQIDCFNNKYLVKDPLVSVVMITYNHEPYLAEAIEGVVRQETSFSFELLIGEDCSTDGTKEVALKYQKQFPEIVRVITSERNVGMHENFSRLLTVARGEYIAICEGDDYWCKSDKLERQISVLETNPDVSLICTDWQVVSDDGTLIKPSVLCLDQGRVHNMELDDILQGRVKTLTVCTRLRSVKNALKESALCRPDRYPFGDHPLWVELSRIGKCRCLPEVSASYRKSQISATRQSDPMKTYRFIAGWGQFDRDVLELYPLRQGEEAATNLKIDATRRRFRSLALLGESLQAKDELRRLEGFNVHIRAIDKLLYIVSKVARPNTCGATALKWCIHLYRAIRYSKWLKGEKVL